MAKKQDAALIKLEVDLAAEGLRERGLFSRLLRAMTRLRKCRARMVRLRKRIVERVEELARAREEERKV